MVHHGANRPPRPPIQRIKGLFWEIDVESINTYEKSWLDPNTGWLDTTRLGGLKKMHDSVFLSDPFSTGRFFQASILYVCRLYNCKMCVGLKENTGAPTEKGWFLGILNRPDSATFTIAPTKFLDWALRNRFNLVDSLNFWVSNTDTSKFNMISLLMHDGDFFQGYNQVQRESIWSIYEQVIAWAENNPRVRNVIGQDIYNLAIDDRVRFFSQSSIAIASDTLLRLINSSSSIYSLPACISVQGDDFLSLNDLYLCLIFSLRLDRTPLELDTSICYTLGLERT